jgi:DNA-binding SARP family transcriptional activator
MLEFRVMGNFEIFGGTRPLTPTAPKLRTVMALLALHRNRVVPVNSLIEEIWSSEPPTSALTTLQTYIYQLRKLFLHGAGEADVLVTKPLGYSANIAPKDLDLCEFDRLVDAGRTALGTRDAGRASALLCEALTLHKGPILSDVQRGPLLEAHAARLEESVLQALTLRIEAELQLGRHTELIGELRALVSEYPLYEDLRAKLMIALYRSDRRSAALQVYHDLRIQLDNELGLDPSPTLRRLHQEVLADAASLRFERAAEPGSLTVAAPAVVPAELPGDLTGFVGRRAELARLESMLTAPTGAVRVAVISAMAGVGKTVLAVHAAHRARSHFPDGQLYAELGGGADRPADPAAVLRGFLRSVGIPSQDIPEVLAERAKLFRTWSADRRGLLLLDNADSAAQIKPLLPGGPGWAVLVTSRYGLRGLPGASQARLDPPPIADGVELLASIIGRARVNREREAAFRLVSLCGRLPLTVRAVGERLAANGHWPLATLLERLCDEPSWLAELSAADLDLPGLIEPSYRRLTEQDRRALLMLGHCGRDVFTTATAASVLETDHGTVDRLLDRLVSSHMLQREGAQVDAIRYRVPRILRLFAWQRRGELHLSPRAVGGPELVTG